MKNNKLCAICSWGRVSLHLHDMESLGRDGVSTKPKKSEEDLIYHIEKGIQINETHFHVATEKGFLEAVKLLIKREGDTEVRDCSQNTPLLIAIKFGHYNIAKYLIENGAD